MVINLAEKKFLILTHTFATGPTQELRDFLLKNKSYFAFIEHPFPYNKKQIFSKITWFKDGQPIKFLESIAVKGPDILFYIKDFVYTLYFVIKGRQHYDLCVAADTLNAFSAWFLKKIGYINKVIYWTIDYTPKRFNNYFLNKIYHRLDKFCCYHCDFLWNSSLRMQEAREDSGVRMGKCAEEIVVEDGCHFENIKRFPDGEMSRFKLVFMGHLVKNKGVDLIINILPILLKDYPEITFTIIGTGEEEDNLKELTCRLEIQSKVVFKGYVKCHREVEEIIASCGIAVAPYVPDLGSFSFFSDVGKVKVYLACGLPVLITDVPQIAREIEENEAGLIFKYNEDSLIRKLRFLLADEKKYLKYRNNAIFFIKNLSWDKIFTVALDKTIASLYKTI